jgi:tol-pal system protein YbgF
MNASFRALSAAAMAALFFLTPMQAHALFEDTDARREILRLRKLVEDLSAKVDPLVTRTDTKADTKSVLNLGSEIERLRADIAELRGQIELLSNDIGNAQRRQRDLYADVDQRLRTLETKATQPAPADNRPAEPAASEQKAFDEALAQFKSANYAGAIQSLSAFLQRYPDSAYLPQAYFWLGSSHFAQLDCANAMPAYQTVVTRFATSPRAADAMLNMASCQLDRKDKGAARETLDNLIKKYPNAPAAAAAKERLAEIK